ncbi:V3 protein [Jatropha leaf crumple virus]|uniref:V3 protein n=1 Tax=Jatropha leaf crumple virus TaxID=1547577 RepID=UPI00050D1416|nr:V3 protein [Jatropha leaf crumple virus]AIR77185.1 V3 protein [Jatropha leaf crumple virus]AIT11630.1 v3 protein [Jatropha leaf crumple India virus [J. curcas: Jodhpur]]AIT11637.1 v3 protein [Jatropha leaf crumple India virus [J. curcas: Jodhpur]]
MSPYQNAPWSFDICGPPITTCRPSCSLHNVGPSSERVPRFRPRFTVYVCCDIRPVGGRYLFPRHFGSRVNQGSHICHQGEELCRSDQQISSFPLQARRFVAV